MKIDKSISAWYSVLGEREREGEGDKRRKVSSLPGYILRKSRRLNGGIKYLRTSNAGQSLLTEEAVLGTN